ncbi:hypothetical protein NQ317_000020 [Molorchus minor]|uniref:Uncharacterized protein n=1 Tax=Molorchus minor TaxID=1323400 RepID=A0ABQ9IUH3_9CUCU|nr:hypothetical protein NQ317_000020 [Molorchus minor]
MRSLLQALGKQLSQKSLLKTTTSRANAPTESTAFVPIKTERTYSCFELVSPHQCRIRLLDLGRILYESDAYQKLSRDPFRGA